MLYLLTDLADNAMPDIRVIWRTTEGFRRENNDKKSKEVKAAMSIVIRDHNRNS
jgi:hypothetical protein